jgi:hypothetical protein
MAVKAMPARPATMKALNGGPMTRVVQDVAGAAEALTVGVVQLAHNTLTAAVETVEDVGGRIGSLAVATARSATRAVSDIGGDIGQFAKGTVQGSIKAVREIKTVLAEAGVRRPPLARVPKADRRPLARAKRAKRSARAPKTAATS